MTSHLEGVQSSEVGAIWHDVEPVLYPVIERMGTHNMSDVLENIILRDWQLWLSWHDGKIEAACLTTIHLLPRMKTCRILAVAGKDLDNWLQFEDILVEWAKSKKCDILAGELRPGWKRKLDNWTFGNVVAERNL